MCMFNETVTATTIIPIVNTKTKQHFSLAFIINEMYTPLRLIRDPWRDIQTHYSLD